MKIVDSSCIICVFHEIKKPFILLDWIEKGYSIVITEQVYNEIKHNEETMNQVKPDLNKKNLKVKDLITENEIIAFKKRYPMLGKGEISVIILAKK